MSHALRPGHGEDHIARLGRESLDHFFLHIFREEFRGRPSQAGFFHLQPDQALGTEFGDIGRQPVDFFTAVFGSARGTEAANAVAVLDCDLDHLKAGPGRKVCQVLDFHIKSQVRAIDPILLHALLIINAKEWQFRG